MKIRTFRNAIITGVLCTALVIPSFAQAADIQPISETELEIVPISYKIDPVIRNIMNNEVRSFISEEKSAEQTAKTIQEKVMTYLNE